MIMPCTTTAHTFTEATILFSEKEGDLDRVPDRDFQPHWDLSSGKIRGYLPDVPSGLPQLLAEQLQEQLRRLVCLPYPHPQAPGLPRWASGPSLAALERAWRQQNQTRCIQCAEPSEDKWLISCPSGKFAKSEDQNQQFKAT